MKLSPVQNKTIEEFWFNIDEYRKQLKFREWELFENKVTDTNIGGGKSNIISDTTGNKAIILAQDKNYQYLQNIVNAIDKLYKEVDDDMRTIIEMRYWDKNGAYEWEEIADKLYVSRSKVLRKRNLLIDMTAERMGWM